MTSEFRVEELGMVDPWADTVRARVLPESLLQPRPGSEPSVPGFDPYSTDIGALTARPRPRRTLDDMRRLSEAIVPSRRAK